MGVSVSTDWTYNDIGTVILENELLRAVIMPELGAKIWQLTYKPRARELLWRHPRLKPRKLPFHSVYDDTFFGGWDELYPNDMPEELNGERMPDHGEVWTLPWEYALEQVAADEVTVRLWVETPISPSRMEKWITLRSGEAKLRFHHRLTNTGQTDQPFLWKLHAAMVVDECSRIDLPAGRMYIEDFGPPRNGRTQISYDWPYLTDDSGARHDMRQALPASAQVNEFQYATELSAGWCALTDTRSRVGFGLAFDVGVLPSCWLFATYGGWRNLHTVVLEPCTGYPISVNEGVERGTHKVLGAGQSIECGVIAVVYEEASGVVSIDAEGNVVGSPR
jgi:hypothetical protein